VVVGGLWVVGVVVGGAALVGGGFAWVAGVAVGIGAFVVGVTVVGFGTVWRPFERGVRAFSRRISVAGRTLGSWIGAGYGAAVQSVVWVYGGSRRVVVAVGVAIGSGADALARFVVRVSVFVERGMVGLVRAVSGSIVWVARAFARGVAVVSTFVWRIVSVVSQAVWDGLVWAARGVWFGISELGKAVWFGTAWTAVLVGRGIVVSTTFTWGVVVLVAVAVWLGVVLVSGRVWFVVAFVAALVSRGGVAVGRFVAMVVGRVWDPVSVGLMMLRDGVGVASRMTWFGIGLVARTIWDGVVFVSLRVWAGVELLWVGWVYLLSFVLRAITESTRMFAVGAGRVASDVSRLMVWMWRPVVSLGRLTLDGLVVSCRNVWRVISQTSTRVWSDFGFVRRPMWRLLVVLGIYFIVVVELIWRLPVFILRSAWNGFVVVPRLFTALWLFLRWARPETEQRYAGLGIGARGLIPLGVMLVMVLVVVRIAPWEPPPPVVVDHWATGHLFFDDGLEVMAARFNDLGHRTPEGNRIEVRVHNNPSSEQTEDLLARMRDGEPLPRECCGDGPDPHVDPTIITPSSAHWVIPLNKALADEGKAPAIDLADSSVTRPIALAYIGIVTYREMAECLGWPEKSLGFADLIALSQNKLGWGAYPCAEQAEREWGTRPLIAFTDPKTSSTGRSVLLSLYLNATEKQPEQLVMSDIHDELGNPNLEVRKYVQEFQGLIDHYMIGTTMLNTKIHQGPQFGHFFLMPEDNLIHLKEGTVSVYVGGKKKRPEAYDAEMVMIYPSEGTLARNNCACLVDAEWVDDEEEWAANLWIDYLREENQQRAFMRAGFRPVSDFPIFANDPDDRITAEFGLTPSRPERTLDVSKIAPEVAREIDAEWEDVKRPGIVTFVVDTSGSMLVGGKLNRAKDGITRGLHRMASNNLVGLVSFDDQANLRAEVGDIGGSGSEGVAHLDGLVGAIGDLEAAGETALYDAIKWGVEMTDSAGVAEELVNPIRAVVVLTDGQANRGSVGLDDLIDMSAFDRVVRSFDGWVDGDDPRVESGVQYSSSELRGTGLAIETEHDVQIFFIGIGNDADLEIGRLLAEATGAEFQGVTEGDLAELLEEFSGYF
jgi:Ca-activated chloride channel family protein